MIFQRPIWLDQEELPRRLLDRFLTKLEKGQRLSLRITSKSAPELYDFQNEDVTFLWALIKSLDNEYNVWTVKLEKTKPHQEVYEDARLIFIPEQEELVREWLNRPALDPYAMVWHDQLEKMQDQFEDRGRALAEQIVRVPEQGAERTLRAFARIGEEMKQPVTLRALAARCLWGDSKFLDRTEDLVRELFPSLVHNLSPRPLLINVHLPQRLEQVLFVENQDTFLALAAHDLPGYALVYSAGFRGSAARVREKGNAVFSFTSALQDVDQLKLFERWWLEKSSSATKAHFWGDLDFAGMAILKALRQAFTNCQAWQPGYGPLLQRLQQGWGHSHEAAGKNLQKDPGDTGCTYADEILLPAMREQGSFVDQEAISNEELGFKSRNEGR